MEKFTCKVDARIPEEPAFEFETSGSQGGNHSHGGYATLIISLDSYANLLSIVDYTGEHIEFEYISKLVLTVRGDMELEGLATNLIHLGKEILLQKEGFASLRKVK